jgi:thioredoxin-like negative regulator of GroEL
MSNEIPEITELKNKVMASPNDLTVRFQLSEVYKQN